jgi:predicted porin
MTFPLKSVALAAASLCLSASALAQSSVSLYGLVDVSAGQFQDAGASKVKKAQSGNMSTSHLGFKGLEDLGGGLKAKFAIESFLRADTGESGRFGGDVFWARAAWVGLQGDFGSATIGRTTNQYFVSTLIFNAFGDSFGYSPSIRQMLTPSSIHSQSLPFLGDTGWSNSALYTSPNMGGVTFNLQGALGEGAAGNKGRNIGANLLYFGGPFAATVAWQQVKQGTTFSPAIITNGFDGQNALQVGASYDAKVVKVFGQYALLKNRSAVETKSKSWGVGASVPVGPGKVLAQYGNSTSEYPTSEVVSKILTVGYDYFLSKSSDVYVVAMQDKLTGLASGNTFAAGIKVRF